MTVEIALVFVIIGIALYLFATEKFPLDITAFLILITVLAIPQLFHSQWLLDRGVDLESAFPTIEEGLSGFSSSATITVLAMFILSAGIQRSGLVHAVGKALGPLFGGSETRQMILITLLVGPISGLINNTAAVAVAIPLVLDMARRAGAKASRLLMPLSFFGMMGGTLTVIGTSTNLLASNILARDDAFGRQIGMFEFLPVGLAVLAAGLIYFLTLGRWLLPKTDRANVHDESEETFVFEVSIPSGSDLVGKSCSEADFVSRHHVSVLRLVRGSESHVKRAETTRLKVDDILHLRGTRRQVMDLVKSEEVEVISEFGERRRLRRDGKLARVLLRNDRVFKNVTGDSVGFWKRYSARLVGLETDSVRSRRLADERLRVGEIVLIAISATALVRLRRHPDVIVLDVTEDRFDKRRMWTAGAILGGVVTAATITPLPIVITALMGVMAMFFTGILRREDLYSGVSWNVIFLLAGVIPLGIAMSKSGGAAWLGGLLAHHAGDWHPLFLLMALYLVTALLTAIVSNNAAVVILVPVALSIAQSLDMAVLPLALVVMFGASSSFLSPVGYQTNTMIFGTGLYRFTDFVRVGTPLNLILMVVTSLAIYALYPLQPG
ncbi:SLC13 family permease [Wenzhouxiangella sp. EGI_FJ10409]|uniref:SLC13 family permease n=1 Tax=Wenzhouxiangella sp. EGI_FJ10409 TaxID=3243767 RepID=UPI0035D6D8F1